MKIIVTRHGQTEWNRLGKLQGQTDNSLNEEGKAQAEETGKQIADEKIDLIISSPLIRARETAEIINKRFNVPIIEDDRIKERNYGQCEGITLEERLELSQRNPIVNNVWNYNENIDFNGIERMHDFCKRVYGFLNDITETYNGKNILIVAHGGVFFPISCYFNRRPLTDMVDRHSVKGLQNCEVARFEIKKDLDHDL